MPMTAFLDCQEINGSGVQKGRVGMIPVIGFHHEVTTEIDPGTGEPGKTRLHSAFVIQKEIDLSTPGFHLYQTSGKALKECTLNLWHMPKSGPEANYFKITLSDATVVSVKMIMPPAYIDANSNTHEYEEVGLEYASIAWQKLAVAAPGMALGNEPSSASFKDMIGSGIFFKGGVFIPDWMEAQAKIAVLKIAAELKGAGFEYGKNLYSSTLRKLKGEPPGVPPPDDK